MFGEDDLLSSVELRCCPVRSVGTGLAIQTKGAGVEDQRLGDSDAAAHLVIEVVGAAVEGTTTLSAVVRHLECFCLTCLAFKTVKLKHGDETRF